MASAVSADQSTEVPPSILRPRQNRLANRDARSMRRIIIKQGYLKKMPNSAKLGSSFKVIMAFLIISIVKQLVFLGSHFLKQMKQHY